MSNDVRPAVNLTQVAGFSEEQNELLNSRLQVLSDGINKLSEQTVIEPRNSAPRYPYDGQIELADGLNWNPEATGEQHLVYYLDGQWHVLHNTDQIIDLIQGNRLIQGYYDQVNDQIIGSGGALSAASNYVIGEYYVLAVSGAFATSLPNLNGLTGGINDRIVVSGSSTWEHVTVINDYLSKIVDDVASGIITMSVGSDSPIPSPGPNFFERQAEVDTKDNTVRAYADAQDAAHEAAPDPHTQYVTNTEALSTFSLAAYGGILTTNRTGFGNLGGGWTEIDTWNAASITSPRYITQEFTSNGLRIEREGVYAVSVRITLEHNSSNSGRTVSLRFLFDGVAGARVFTYGVGRNAEYTNLIIPGSLVLVPAGAVDQLVTMQIGNGDSFTGVDIVAASFEAYGVSEAHGLEAGV